MHKYWY